MADPNRLESGKMTTGSGTKCALKSIQDSKCKEILLTMRSCLKTTTVYLQKHLPVSNGVLCDSQCLHPLVTEETVNRSGNSCICHEIVLKNVLNFVHF